MVPRVGSEGNRARIAEQCSRGGVRRKEDGVFSARRFQRKALTLAEGGGRGAAGGHKGG